MLLAAGGDYSDYQQMLKIIEASAVTEYTMDDHLSCTVNTYCKMVWPGQQR